MIVYRCDHCGEPIPWDRSLNRPERILLTLTTPAAHVEHFCSILCVTAFAEWAGYHQPPTDGVVDAQIHCGAQSATGRDCRYLDGHTGTHIPYGAGPGWT